MVPPNCPVSDLSEYVAVPGKIIKIPGTDYVLISPVKNAEERAVPAIPAPPLSVQIRRRGRPTGKSTPCQCPNCQEDPKSDRHICHIENCGKTFTKRNHLESHLRNHMGVRPFTCPHQDCGAKFVRADELRRHHWSHSTKARFQCSFCDKSFYRADAYKLHTNRCNANIIQHVKEIFQQENDEAKDVEGRIHENN